MYIQILPLSTPLPDNYIVNQNTITADWYSGDDAFKNGTYIISSSSYSNGYEAYNLVDGNDNTTFGKWYSDYKSASSVERVEEFIKLGRPDPAEYADETGPVTWEHVVNEVTKVLENHGN